MAQAGKAVAVKLGDRYFYGFGPSGRVLTAWSLAGAALFGEWQDGLVKVERKLLAVGKMPRRVVVTEL